MRISIYLFAILLGLLFLTPAQAVAQEAVPATAQEWLAKLKSVTSDSETFNTSFFPVVNTFVTYDSDVVYETLRTGWTTIAEKDTRLFLIHCIGDDALIVRNINGKTVPDNTHRLNPHLLDLLELGLSDSDKEVREEAQRRISGIAYRKFDNVEAFRIWRAAPGNQSLESITRTNVQALVRKLASASDAEILELLHTLGSLSFYDNNHYFVVGHPSSVIIDYKIDSGLCSLRKKAAHDAGIIPTLLRLLRPESPDSTRLAALNFLPVFDPDPAEFAAFEPFIKRWLDLWMDSRTPGFFGYQMIAKHHTPWFAQALLRRLRTVTTESAMMTIIFALGETHAPEVIPTLITLYDRMPPRTQESEACDRALCQLTNVQHEVTLGNPRHYDSEWWRNWWSSNKSRFPREVRSLPYPHLSLHWTPERYDRKSSPAPIHSLAGDGNRSYCLILPRRSPEPLNTERQGKSPAPILPGLIVGLIEADPNSETVQDFWRKIADSSADQRYVIALVLAPYWKDNPAVQWVTSGNRHLVPEATFTTEEFVSGVVRDVRSTCEIDPSRIYLYGEEDSGIPCYCCALEKETPFHGFLLWNSPFHSAQLPPLNRARLRDFCLRYSQNGAVTPLLAQAAAKVLQDAGANVNSAVEPDSPPGDAQKAKVASLRSAIAWLETRGKKPPPSPARGKQ